jgi:cell division septal protein FtsQ
MELTTLTTEEILQEIKDLAQYQGISNQEAWDGLVDEVIDAHLDLGEFNSEEDLESLKENLKTSWSQYEADMAEPDQFKVEEKEESEQEELLVTGLDDEDEEEEEVI